MSQRPRNIFVSFDQHFLFISPPSFDLNLAFPGFCESFVFFEKDDLEFRITFREKSAAFFVVIFEASLRIIGNSNIQVAVGILDNVDVMHECIILPRLSPAVSAAEPLGMNSPSTTLRFTRDIQLAVRKNTPWRGVWARCVCRWLAMSERSESNGDGENCTRVQGRKYVSIYAT